VKVGDTNVIAYLVIPGEQTAVARALLLSDAEWLAPPLWRSEFLNVLALYIHKGLISLEEAEAYAAEAEHFMHGRVQNVQAASVLKLAAESRCSAYDCEFIALAKKLNTRLVTNDRPLIKAFPEETVPLDTFLS